MLTEVLDALDNHDSTLRAVARRCTDPDPRRRYRNIQAVHLALDNRNSRRFYIMVIGFLVLMVLLLAWLLSPYRPNPPIN